VYIASLESERSCIYVCCIHTAPFYVLYCFVHHCLSFCLFKLLIAFSLLRITACDSPVGIFKLYLHLKFSRLFVFIIRCLWPLSNRKVTSHVLFRSFASLPKIFLLNFGTVPTVSYIFCFSFNQHAEHYDRCC
jgi:hypothetical protein